MPEATQKAKPTADQSNPALLVSERRFRAMVENAGDAIYIHDRFGNISDINQVACDQTGYTRDELLALNVAQLDAATDFENLRKTWDMGQADPDKYPITLETAHRRKDESVFPIEVRISLLPNEGDFLFVAMVRDISKRVNAMEAAEAANRAKSDFLSSMSHELRTPLNAILGFTQLMQFDPATPLTEGQRDSTEQIMKGGYHLLELINQILELSKIEAGKLSMSIEPIAIRTIMGECFDMVLSMADKRNITLNTDTVDFPEADVMADYTRVKQVILNLLSNAVKYNNEGGSISVEAHQKGDDTIRISVTDTGPGIPQDQQASIFEPFNRLGHERSEIEGTGIGLVITRELLHLMKGQIGFNSEVGRGTTFWIELPVATHAPEITPYSKEISDDQTDLVTSIGNEDHKYTVLYVEDIPSNIQLMEGILQRFSNLELMIANTAEQGIQQAQTQNPDLILMDINLPEMDGYEAMERLKVNKETSLIPVIAVTAQASKSEIMRGRHAGFVSYITKPIDINKMLCAIKRELEKQG